MKESPQYLYSKDKFNELKDCLRNIAARNGIYSSELRIERLTEQLKNSKAVED